MTDKVCQLYEEEQIGKVREGRKAVPNSKIPELGWDIAETQLQMEREQTGYQKKHTNKQPTDTMPPPGNNSHSCHNNNNIGTHQIVHPRNT